MLVSTALCIPPTLTAHLLSTADALLHNNPTHVLHLLVQELCTQLACMETHPPALYSLVHAVAGHAGHGADEVGAVHCMYHSYPTHTPRIPHAYPMQTPFIPHSYPSPPQHLEQLATALARHFGRVFVGTAAKDALRQTLTPAGSAASTPTRAGRGASSHSASATPQRLQMAINRAALRSHPVGGMCCLWGSITSVCACLCCFHSLCVYICVYTCVCVCVCVYMCVYTCVCTHSRHGHVVHTRLLNPL